jgi:hypothetical protein
MPAYEYEIPELGQTITLIRPVERRDEPVLIRRMEVPRTLAISGAAANPWDPETQMRQGWKRLEERGLPAWMAKKSTAAREIMARPVQEAAGLTGTTKAES